MALKHKLNFLSPSMRILRRAKKIANRVESLKDKYKALSNQELSNRTAFFIEEINKGKTIDNFIDEALATVREACFRVHKLFAFKVQIIGAIVAHFGDFAEMYTGEGKTLVIVLLAYLNALNKKGVHIVTVNEYLVQRDAKFCAQALNPLNITVGYNLSSLDQDQKRKMYQCDITYTTNSEIGFDYLRDNMVRNYNDKVIRNLNFAIIDEGDSILIDEARTPLIISGQPKTDVSMYAQVDSFVKKLINDDYKIDQESKSVTLTDSGVKKANERYKVRNFYDLENSELVHKVRNALMANYVFKEGVEYLVKNNEIFLIDQFTGRILEGRSYSAGLQQAIQAKEYVKIEPENMTVATITYQSFFRLYNKLAGVSGTAITEAEEFLKIYNMVVVPIPTNKPVIRKDFNDYVFANKISKWHHVVAEIEETHKKGQPILVGTSSVEDSEELTSYLKNKGLNFELLNAKNHAREAEIIKLAGQKGSITIATNMAGRGTDIKLGEGVAEMGGLYVIGTERHESRRIDNQLRGRSGRQGDKGMTRFFISLQDTLFKRFAEDRIDKSSEKIDNDYYDSWFFTRLLNTTQKKVEALNFDTRKHLIDYDSVLSNQRELVYKQRDQILLNIDNVQIIKNMAKTVSEEFTKLFKRNDDETYVREIDIALALNNRLLNVNILTSKLFSNKTISESTSIVNNILNISIDTRVENFEKEQVKQLLKDILIQNLDYFWTQHLDLITKIREGVTLRSLEQRSPLNIYIQEADWHFEQMKKNIAHSVIINLHKIYIPKINDFLYKKLSETLPNDCLNNELFNKNSFIDNAFNHQPNIKIDVNNKSTSDSIKKTINKKQEFLEKIKQAQQEQTNE